MTYNISPAVTVDADQVIQFDSKDCPIKSCGATLVSPLFHPGGYLTWPPSQIAVIEALTVEQSREDHSVTTVYIKFHKLITSV